MEKFFNAHGRKMIGWDEVLEGGVSSTATIMYWRTWVPKAPVEAAKNGNPVIMTPGSPLYFDGNQDKNSLPAVYHFHVVPKGLTRKEAKNIIGAQANIWTEYIPTEARADYMSMPRMTALAEALWTNHPDYPSYLRRLQTQYTRLDTLKVHYRLPDLTGFAQLNVFTNQDTLWIQRPLDNLAIHYTTDSTAPTMTSPILSKPLIIRQPPEKHIRQPPEKHIRQPQENLSRQSQGKRIPQSPEKRIPLSPGKNVWVRIAAFRPDGSHGDIYTLQYQQQSLATPATASTTKDGLRCSRYKGHFRMTTRMTGRIPDTTLTVRTLVVPSSVEAPSFGLQYRGYLDIPTDGIYTFYLTCDDGGTLKIAGRDVVNNDGNHSAIEKDGQVALQKGLQPIALDFIEAGGGYTLQLKYSFNGSEPQEIPAKWLKN
jgi:hexosaminidase